MRQRNQTIWVLAADCDHSRLFAHDALTDSLLALSLDGLPAHGAGAVHKRHDAGRTHESGHEGTRHAIAPHTDIHDLEVHRAARTVADAINRAAAQKQFDRLIIAAPPRFVGELRQHLSAQAMQQTELTAKDLAGLPSEEILEHLSGVLHHTVPV